MIITKLAAIKCLLPVLMIATPSLKDPKKTVDLPAPPDVVNKVDTLPDLKWLKDLWRHEGAHVFCQKAGHNCAAAILIHPDDTYIKCVTLSTAEE